MVLLIADTEITDARYLKTLISWNDYGFQQVNTAYSFEKANQLIYELSPDLFICSLDIFESDNGLWLTQYKDSHPWTEFIVTAKELKKESFHHLLHLNVLDYLEKPASEKELETILSLYNKKASMRKDMERALQNTKYQSENNELLQELFWKNLCLNRLTGNPEELEETAMRFNASLDKDASYQMIMVSLKNEDEMWSSWGEDFCQNAIQNLARSILGTPQNKTRIIVIYNRVILVLLHEEFETVQTKCKDFIQCCKDELKAEALCYISEPVFCEQLPKVYNELFIYSRDDVLKQKRIIRLKQQAVKMSAEIVVPKIWEDILYTPEPLNLVAEVRSFLLAFTKQNHLNAEKFRIFQQDMLQLFFSYMEKKGLSAHKLYDNPEIFKLYKAAPYSIDAMCLWVQRCTDYITQKRFSEISNPKEQTVEIIKEYIHSHLGEHITINQLAELVYLSPDYITKIFKQITGITLKKYIMEIRLEEAKKLLRTSEDTIGNIAAEVGYDNLSYFISQFQKCYSITPKQYQLKNEHK